MSFTKNTSFTTQAPTLFGRGDYNGPGNDSEDDDSHAIGTAMFLNRGDDDDEEEDGRGGYN